MATARKIFSLLNPLAPFKKAAASTFRAPRAGADIIKDLLSRLPQALGESAALPEKYDPYEHFRTKAQRFGHSKQSLQDMERALLASKRVFIAAVPLIGGTAGAMLITADSAFQVFNAVALLPFCVLCLAKSLQLSVYLVQIRQRALYSFPQFLRLFRSKVALLAHLLDPEWI